MSIDTRKQQKRPVFLCILDGWGHRTDVTDNAIARAHTPNWDDMVATRPMSLLGASGADVGLPEGQMGNSEVGHMTIGSGRIILQDLPRINNAIDTGALASNENLQAMISTLLKSGGACHLAGLLSPGGVHSHQDHMVALAKIISDAGVTVYIHGFMDGRDTAPTSGAGYLKQVSSALAGLPSAKLATLCGRYFAMDRDLNWDRVSLSYNAMFHGIGDRVSDFEHAMTQAYADNENDEFLKPRVLEDFDGIKDGDAFLMANFRADRARQMMNCITDEIFDGFDRGTLPTLSAVVGMIEYSSALSEIIPCLFPAVGVKNTLGQITSAAGRRQLRIAETEKYAHVTFFLNGGEEDVFEGEERILIPSPKVATYDLQPKMSAPEVLSNLTNAIESDKFDLIIVNFANPDMVGHTGVMAAAIEAVEYMDHCIGQLAATTTTADGIMLVTADHGNIELMRDPHTHAPHTAHTTNLVPFVLAAGDLELTLDNGTLADVAPTLLTFMGLSIPEDMTGKNLAHAALEKRDTRAAS